MMNREKLKAFPLKSTICPRCPLFPFIANVVLEVLARATSKMKMIKGMQEKRSQTILFSDAVILLVKDSQHFIRKPP